MAEGTHRSFRSKLLLGILDNDDGGVLGHRSGVQRGVEGDVGGCEVGKMKYRRMTWSVLGEWTTLNKRPVT